MGFELLIIIFSFIVLALVLTLIKLRDDQIVDQARKNLFSIRFEMTIYAIERGIQDSASFMQIRRRVNNSIRFTHKTNVTNILIGIYLQKDKKIRKEIKSHMQRNDQSIKNLSQKDREFFNLKIEEMKQEMFMVLIRRSLLLSIFARSLYTAYVMRNFFRSTYSFIINRTQFKVLYIDILPFIKELDSRYGNLIPPVSKVIKDATKVTEYEASACRA